MDKISQRFNQLARRYLITPHNLRQFKYHYLYTFIILSKMELDKLINKYSKNKIAVNAKYFDSNHWHDGMNHDYYLVSILYNHYRPMNSDDLKKLALEMKIYLCTTGIFNHLILLFASNYSAYDIQKYSGVNQSIISRVRHHSRKITNLKITNAIALNKFFYQSKLPVKYGIRTINRLFLYQSPQFNSNRIIFNKFNDTTTIKHLIKTHNLTISLS